MAVICKKGKCFNDGEGTEVADDRIVTHALGHAQETIMGRVDEVTGEVNKALGDLMEKTQQIEKAIAGVTRHASLKEMVEHATDCPDCAKSLEDWRGHIIKEYEAAHPQPQPTTAPEPKPIAETPPAPKPKRLIFPSLDDIPGSPQSRGAYKVEEVEAEGGVQLRVKDEEVGKEALEAGVVPACRWVKGEDGKYLYACEGGKE